MGGSHGNIDNKHFGMTATGVHHKTRHVVLCWIWILLLIAQSFLVYQKWHSHGICECWICPQQLMESMTPTIDQPRAQNKFGRRLPNLSKTSGKEHFRTTSGSLAKQQHITTQFRAQGRLYMVFMYHSPLELPMLELRFNEQWEFVHRFVILESHFFSDGSDRDLELEAIFRSPLWSRFKDKVATYVIPRAVVENHRGEDKGFDFYQRSQYPTAARKAGAQESDFLLISDLDEIASSAGLRLLSTTNSSWETPVSIQTDGSYYYDFGCHDRAFSVEKLTIIRLRELSNEGLFNAHDLRTTHKMKQKIFGRMGFYVPKSGWHLSFFGDTGSVLEKSRHASHESTRSEKKRDPRYVACLISNCGHMREGSAARRRKPSWNRLPTFVVGSTEPFWTKLLGAREDSTAFQRYPFWSMGNRDWPTPEAYCTSVYQHFPWNASTSSEF